MVIEFLWDPERDRENQRKHGVSFKEATTIFETGPLDIYFDPDHSAHEDRYIAIGISNRRRLLLVVHCENRLGTKIRIISARKATRREEISVFGGKNK